MPIRTRNSAPSGHSYSASARWPSTAAATASLARRKATKNESPCVSISWPPWGHEPHRGESRVLRQPLPVKPAEPLQQARGPLDVREEEGDGSGGPLAGRCHSRGVLFRAF